MIVKSYLFLSSFIGKCSYDLWERSFDKPDKSLLREGWDFFSQCMEVIKKYNLIKTVTFFPAWSAAFLEFSFYNLAANFRTNGQKISAESPKMIKN